MEKLSKDEFWNLTNEDKTEYGFMLRTTTKVCQYGQAYKKETSKEERKERYLNFYYKMYLNDFENSQEFQKEQFN